MTAMARVGQAKNQESGASFKSPTLGGAQGLRALYATLPDAVVGSWTRSGAAVR